MQIIALFAVALVAVAAGQGPDIDDATAHCFTVQGRRNQKDLYASGGDCHNYIQCFYMDDGETAKGYTRSCPLGQFFHEPVLSCMPEGTTPCVDRCLDSAVNAKGCYPGLGCSQYYVCSNTGSYGMCCPKGTRFIESSCSCEESATCTDSCVQQAPPTATTVAPPETFNRTVCEDSFGSFISTVPGRSNAFCLIDDEGHCSTIMTCPAGYSFSVFTCRCDVESGVTSPPEVDDRQAVVYVNFNRVARDSSPSNFNVFLFDGARITTRNSAHGSGSLRVNGGRSEIPGMKTFDSRNHGSWCSFFFCTNSNSCNGGVLSNNRNDNTEHFTAVFGVSNGIFQGTLNFWSPVGKLNVANSRIEADVDAWNQFCVTYDSNNVVTYFNGLAAETQFVSGFLFVSHAPFTIGSDQEMGTFRGLVDEVLITPFAMTAREVRAHFEGDTAYLANRGFWGRSSGGFFLGDAIETTEAAGTTEEEGVTLGGSGSGSEAPEGTTEAATP